MTTKRNPLLRLLAKHDACGEAVEWVTAGGHDSLAAAWKACERGDWMLWLYAKMGGDRKRLVLAACDCAATSLPIFEAKRPDDKRPRKAIETARKWVRGKATLVEVRDAAAAANAAYAAYAYTYTYADAADAAYAAYAAADAAYAAAAAAADDAAYAAYAAARARGEAREKWLKKCATLVRKRIPDPEAK